MGDEELELEEGVEEEELDENGLPKETEEEEPVDDEEMM
jgi:hypothetical protein